MTDYVCLRFSEHIVQASSSSDKLVQILISFFETNVLCVLCWIDEWPN